MLLERWKGKGVSAADTHRVCVAKSGTAPSWCYGGTTGNMTHSG